MVVIVFEHTNVVLSTWEEDTAETVEFIVDVLPLMDLIVVKHFATNTYKKIGVFSKLSCIGLVWESYLFEFYLPIVQIKILAIVPDNIMDW